MFQSRTGFPGHLALAFVLGYIGEHVFQSRTGFPGHLALALIKVDVTLLERFNPERASQAI